MERMAAELFAALPGEARRAILAQMEKMLTSREWREDAAKHRLVLRETGERTSP